MESQQIPIIRLDPGELFIGRRPAEVQTLLGSCVAVAMYDPRQHLGAICHSLLASRECQQAECGLKVCRLLTDYVTCSMRFMLAYFDQHGTLRRDLEVKLFGGANMFSLPGGERNQEPIGKRNVDAAMAVIRQERLHLLAADVGGGWSRSLIFSTATGEVRMKQIKRPPSGLHDRMHQE